MLVHIGVPDGEPMPQIGDFVTATVTHAGRHNLIADPDVNAGQTYGPAGERDRHRDISETTS